MKTAKFTKLSGHTSGKPNDPGGRIYVSSNCPTCDQENESTLKLTDFVHATACRKCGEVYEIR